MYKLHFVNGRSLIIDLHLNGKTVIIAGAGNEALKRIKLLESEKCKVIVIGEKPHSEIVKLSKQKKISQARLESHRYLGMHFKEKKFGQNFQQARAFNRCLKINNDYFKNYI